jgi:ABC-type dipeptide/oligopeptide/nickel transport system permease component
MNLKTLVSSKTLRFIAITVVLGAVGSGGWEWLLKPLLTGGSEILLNVATLGIRAFKDALYRDIAKGFHEEPALRVHLAVFGLLPAFLLGILQGYFVARRRVTSKGGDGSDRGIERLMTKLVKPTLILGIFLLVFFIVQANQLAYVNRAVGHMQQLFAIVDPYISDLERLRMRSAFAE